MLGANYEMDPKEVNTIKLIQKEAAKEGKVFFIESGEGHELITEDLWLEDLFGWLIPEEMATVFNKIYTDKEGFNWLNSDENTWEIYSCCAEWEETEDGYKYRFVYYTNILDIDMYGI